jgi:hypothetical protein
MDCMASKAAAKNGLVLSSQPAASGIMVQSLRATTECEFDLGPKTPDRRNRLEPWIATKGMMMASIIALRHYQPDRTSLMACSINSRPSRCAAALRAGLDLICARHLRGSTVGTKSCSPVEPRAAPPP